MIELGRKRIGSLGGGVAAGHVGDHADRRRPQRRVTCLLKINTGVQVMLTAFLATFIGLVVFVMVGSTAR